MTGLHQIKKEEQQVIEASYWKIFFMQPANPKAKEQNGKSNDGETINI